MTAVKFLLRITSIVMPVIFLFSSCGSNFVEAYPYLPLDDSESGENEIEEVIIRLGDGAAAEVIDCAHEFADAIEKKTGVSCYVTYENSVVELETSGVEILIGNTSRDESKKALYGMRSRDYVCKWSGNVIVLGGRSDGATVTAIGRFCSEILPVSSKFSLMPEKGGFYFKDEYAVEGFKLNGMDIGEYAIEIDSFENTAITEVAISLRKSISDELGFWLDIAEKGKGDDCGGRIYVSGRTENDSEGAFYIIPSALGLELCATDIVGLTRCTERFLNELLSAASIGKNACSISERMRFFYGTVECSIASLCLDGRLPFGSAAAVSIAVAPIVENSPNLVLCGELDSLDGQRVCENIIGYLAVTDGGSAYYGYSMIGCQLLEAQTIGSLNMESYRVTCGACDFILVRISGSVENETSVELSDAVKNEGLPTLAIVHVLNSEGVVPQINGTQMSLTCSRIEDSGESEYSFFCYADTSRLSARLDGSNNTVGYCEISVTVDY